MTDLSDITVEECQNKDVKENFKFKMVIVGNSGVGKTNLVKRFIYDSFSKDTKATVGVEFLYKTFIINGKIFKVELWDTAGQERYKSMTSAYYKSARGALIVFDVTNQKSFDDIDTWCKEVREKAPKSICVMVIGNKTDLTEQRCITQEQAKEKGNILQAAYMETSALDSTNVREAFYLMLKQMYLGVKDALEGAPASSDQSEAAAPGELGSGTKLETAPEKDEKGGCC